MNKFSGQVVVMKDAFEEELCMIIGRSSEEELCCLFSDSQEFEIREEFLHPIMDEDGAIVYGKFCRPSSDKMFAPIFLRKNKESLVKEIETTSRTIKWKD